MTPLRIQLLNDIDFIWDFDTYNNNNKIFGTMATTTKFEKDINNMEQVFTTMDDILMLKHLQRFKIKYGNCFVPTFFPDHVELGQWVNMQRQLYRIAQQQQQQKEQQKEKGVNNNQIYGYNMTEEKLKQLIDTGLNLTMSNISFGRKAFETLWEIRIEELRKYVREHGNCNVTFDHHSDGAYNNLALWIKEQRVLYARHTNGFVSHFNKERISDMEKLGVFLHDSVSE